MVCGRFCSRRDGRARLLMEGVAVTDQAARSCLGLALADQRRAMHNRVNRARLERITAASRGGPRTAVGGR